MENYTLLRPIDFEGERVTEISYDLESLNGGDMLAIERQFLNTSNGNQYIMVKETTKEFQVYVLAKAAGKPVEFFFALKAQDFSQLTMRVNNFFIEAELATMAQAEQQS
ncbi:phage tail assembly protein [Paenibacillaceae bacterium]|nr:phage tail assembly protein [Paenibacillaceae bacterium]